MNYTAYGNKKYASATSVVFLASIFILLYGLYLYICAVIHLKMDWKTQIRKNLECVYF